MKRNPSSAAVSIPDFEWLTVTSCNRKVHYHVHKSPPSPRPRVKFHCVPGALYRCCPISLLSDAVPWGVLTLSSDSRFVTAFWRYFVRRPYVIFWPKVCHRFLTLFREASLRHLLTQGLSPLSDAISWGVLTSSSDPRFVTALRRCLTSHLHIVFRDDCCQMLSHEVWAQSLLRRPVALFLDAVSRGTL
jgi:hypothetical protein